MENQRKVFVLDDLDIRHEAFARREKDATIAAATTYAQACKFLQDGPYDVAYLDHDIGDWYKDDTGKEIELTGRDVVKYLLEQVPKEKWPKRVVVHSWNVRRGQHMVDDLRAAEIPAVYEPFTA